MGVESQLFVGGVDDTLNCPFCLDVFDQVCAVFWSLLRVLWLRKNGSLIRHHWLAGDDALALQMSDQGNSERGSSHLCYHKGFHLVLK